jgi:guanylate kinase
MGRRGIPFVVSAPSGTGKTTVCKALVASDPGLRFSISHTTRAPRNGERDGVDYHFVDRARFAELLARDAFLEHAEYAGNLYGTSYAALEAPLAAGHDLLLEIEVQGARQVRERRPDARLVFLLPPSVPELEQRLAGRGSDTPEAVRARLDLAHRELAEKELFDYAIVNDDLDRCVAAVRAVIAAERARPERAS